MKPRHTGDRDLRHLYALVSMAKRPEIEPRMGELVRYLEAQSDIVATDRMESVSNGSWRCDVAFSFGRKVAEWPGAKCDQTLFRRPGLMYT